MHQLIYTRWTDPLHPSDISNSSKAPHQSTPKRIINIDKELCVEASNVRT
jgi:hypothetical protein